MAVDDGRCEGFGFGEYFLEVGGEVGEDFEGEVTKRSVGAFDLFAGIGAR